MRIAFLFNYALADNQAWKQELIASLRPNHELLVIFGKNRIRDYVQGYMKRRRDFDLTPPIARNIAALVGEPLERKRRTVTVLRRLGVRYHSMRSVNSEECRRRLRAFRPDYVVTALDHMLSAATIDCAPIVLNAHYGVLPQVKGVNAREWSLLLQHELSVSLHRVIAQIDAGEIYMTRRVDVAPDSTLESLRAASPLLALELYKAFFADPERSLAAARPNVGGQTYFAMNRQLKALVRDIVESGLLVQGA